MTELYSKKSAKDILDIYFIENRAKLLDIASFLDRIDRYAQPEDAKNDFRYRAFVQALGLLLTDGEQRTRNIQVLFSDPTTEPLDSAVGLKALGAWEGEGR